MESEVITVNSPEATRVINGYELESPARFDVIREVIEESGGLSTEDVANICFSIGNRAELERKSWTGYSRARQAERRVATDIMLIASSMGAKETTFAALDYKEQIKPVGRFNSFLFKLIS